MKYTFFLLLLASCLHKGETQKTERGRVIAKQYSPDTRQTVTGMGISSNGDTHLTFHYIGEDQKFDIVFKCDHGVVFTISDPEIYSKLEPGDTVNIDYYELVNKKGVVKDYDFIDANKIK